jgi:hypothetical protein
MQVMRNKVQVGRSSHREIRCTRQEKEVVPLKKVLTICRQSAVILQTALQSFC